MHTQIQAYLQHVRKLHRPMTPAPPQLPCVEDLGGSRPYVVVQPARDGTELVQAPGAQPFQHKTLADIILDKIKAQKGAEEDDDGEAR